MYIVQMQRSFKCKTFSVINIDLRAMQSRLKYRIIMFGPKCFIEMKQWVLHANFHVCGQKWSKPPHTNWCSGLPYLIPLILNLTIFIVTKIAIPFWVLNYSYFIIAKRFHKWKQMYRISKLSDIWISFKLCQAVHELCSWPFLGCSFCYMWHIACSGVASLTI